MVRQNGKNYNSKRWILNIYIRGKDMAYKKYHLTFKFCDTEGVAQALCGEINANATPYMRRKHPAHYTPWDSRDGKEHCFVVWYYY